MYTTTNLNVLNLSVFRAVQVCIGLPVYLPFKANLKEVIINYIKHLSKV